MGKEITYIPVDFAKICLCLSDIASKNRIQKQKNTI